MNNSMPSPRIHKTIGNGSASWQDNSPLTWTMQQPSRTDGLPDDVFMFDLSVLVPNYALEFLLALKEVLLQSKHRKRLLSVQNEYDVLRQVFKRVAAARTDGALPIERIDVEFLVALNRVEQEVPLSYLRSLKSFFRRHRTDPRLFGINLHLGDFPAARSKRTAFGNRIHSILAKALRRTTLVHVLNVVETAFEENRLELSRYSFIRLAFSIFCRPDSYRRLTLASLRLDTDLSTGAVNYFLDVPPAKNRAHKPTTIVYRLHPEVGKLLALQRMEVVKTFGHLAPVGEKGPEYGRLALFPALSVSSSGDWVSRYAGDRFGVLPRASFSATYLKPIRTLSCEALTFNALRHTIGTQLAQMGCSAPTIQSVLKHASEDTAQAYVDIVFEGLMDELSDSLEPAFNTHFPVAHFVSANSHIPVERRIESDDPETARIETTGMCGRTVTCSYAPLSCYGCHRFIPCYDADHTINLDVVTKEIESAEERGLAMKHDLLRWKTIRNQVRVVIAACDVKQRSLDLAAT